jgi:hypothetical protein
MGAVSEEVLLATDIDEERRTRPEDARDGQRDRATVAGSPVTGVEIRPRDGDFARPVVSRHRIPTAYRPSSADSATE